jgi:hypothetical protein
MTSPEQHHQIIPQWLLVETAYPELELAARRESIQALGGIAIRGEAGAIDTREQVNDSTLMSTIQRAALLGEPKDIAVVDMNISKDIGERLSKAGLYTKVKLQANNSVFEQNGKKLSDMSLNALKYTTLNGEMEGRTKQDHKNVAIIQKLHAEGILKTHYAVVHSTTSTTMSQADKKDYNFYTDTETCSIQLFAADGDDIALETALVAGKATPTSPRHDIKTIKKLAETFGAPLDTDDGNEIQGKVLLIPKEALPNGLVDLVKLYDDEAGGTFYGEAKPRQDYLEHREFCRQREKNQHSMVLQIRAQLLKEAHAFETPLEAILRLDYLSERFCVKYATTNKEVNALVFGPTAALHVEEARFFLERGETKRAEESLHAAQKTAVSGSCPLNKNGNPEDNNNPNSKPDEEASSEKWMKCPHCTARVFADPCAKVLACWDCKAMVINGSVFSKGNGGRKALAAKRKAQAEAKAAALETKISKQANQVFEEAGIESFEQEQQESGQITAEASRPAGKLALVGAGL